MLVKLAVQHGLASRKTVQVLTTDTYRIAAAEELRSYAAILGIVVRYWRPPRALTQAISEFRQMNESSQKDLILIDTPGLCCSELEAYEDLAKLMAARPGIDTHLVLSASMRTADFRRVSKQYNIFTLAN